MVDGVCFSIRSARAHCVMTSCLSARKMHSWVRRGSRENIWDASVVSAFDFVFPLLFASCEVCVYFRISCIYISLHDSPCTIHLRTVFLLRLHYESSQCLLFVYLPFFWGHDFFFTSYAVESFIVSSFGECFFVYFW